jgi:predicted histidine transporter YuiF (NhaC family)
MNLKKVGYYISKGVCYLPRITPGVGLVSLGIRDWKTRKKESFPYYNFKKKEDLKILGKYAIQLGWLAFAIFKAGITYKGAQSLINKINNSNHKIEKATEKENKLEKTINYYKIPTEKFIN